MKSKFGTSSEIMERAQKVAAKTLRSSNRDRALAARYGLYVYAKRKPAEAGK